MHYNWNTLAYMPTSAAPKYPFDYGNELIERPQRLPPQMLINEQIQNIRTPQMPMMQGQEIYTYPQNLAGAIKLIEEAVAGENEDRLFYQYLINNAPSEEDKEIIRGIRENEITHFGLFRQIYSQLTGKMLPVPEDVTFEEPASYCEGIKKAIKGEQNAVIKYRKILFAMQNRVHINMLTEIITDEIRHGILYNLIYTKNGCRDKT